MRSSFFAGLFVLLSLTAVSAQTKAQFINDMNTLNYALALENFEAYLYQQFVLTFPTAASAGVSPLFYQYLTDAKSAESAHAVALNTTIKSSGWLPAPACTYNLNNSSIGALGTDPAQWIRLLALVEDTGAAAYTYASQLLTNSDLLQFAATVATVEARHAAFLNALANSTGTNLWGNRFGGNAGFNDQLDVAGVVNALVANNFLVSCPNVTGSTFDGVKTFSVFDHTGNGAYVPKLASSFRNATGTFNAFGNNGVKLNQVQYAQDTLVLQYALTAENAEAAFYAATLDEAVLSRSAWVSYFTSLNPYASANASLVYDFLLLIKGHEAGHAATLTSVVNARAAAGHAVPPCTYNFTGSPLNLTPNDPLSFLTAARALEDVGVQAYAGAITLISDTTLVPVAASIALVEARHAAYLRTLLKDTGLLPTASANNQVVDTTLTPVQVAGILGATFSSCPNNTAADPNNPSLGVYNSGTLKYNLLTRLTTGGFNDNGAFSTGTTNSNSNTNTNPNTTPNTPSTTKAGSASGIFVSVAISVAAVFALVF
jgi:rubrerythrin